MAETTRCERCGGQNPSDARFCIDCGASLAPVAIGPTTRLAGVPCPNCKTTNPEHARFCVVCGRSMVDGAARRPQPALAPAPARRPPQSYPRVDVPTAPIPVAPAPPARRRANHGHQIGPLVFLFGLLVLAATRSIWPGILLLVGIYSLVRQTNRGQPDRGLMSLIWLGGLAFLFATHMFWPGILVLVLLSMMLGGWGGPHRRRYW